MIQTSLEWPTIENNLMSKAKLLKNSKDVKKMLKNINIRISELSKAEVAARRGKPNRAKDILEKVNQEILIVREYLLLAALLG